MAHSRCCFSLSPTTLQQFCPLLLFHLNQKFPRHPIIALLAQIKMMHFPILFRKKVPCHIKMRRALAQNTFLHRQLLSAPVADNRQKDAALSIFSHAFLAFLAFILVVPARFSTFCAAMCTYAKWRSHVLHSFSIIILFFIPVFKREVLEIYAGLHTRQTGNGFPVFLQYLISLRCQADADLLHIICMKHHNRLTGITVKGEVQVIYIDIALFEGN